jgi:peptide/nickel transport system substrate-binding protein
MPRAKIWPDLEHPVRGVQWRSLVWDMLYGMDDRLQPRRQMVEAEEVSADGLAWTFRLRPALAFHDGERVLAKDGVASAGKRATTSV